jgi:DNA adenine methylase
MDSQRRQLSRWYRLPLPRRQAQPRARLCQIIDATPHVAYAEPFVGMGGVFLRRSRRPKCEVINDISEDVATFFRILQRHYVAFMDMLRFQLTTRAGFERLMRTDPSTLTDLERAARFLYLQRTAFGGKVVGRNFGVDVMDSPARFDVTKLGRCSRSCTSASPASSSSGCHMRIHRYAIRSAGDALLPRPALLGLRGRLRRRFARDDFERLAEQLAGSAASSSSRSTTRPALERGLRPLRVRGSRDDLFDRDEDRAPASASAS